MITWEIFGTKDNEWGGCGNIKVQVEYDGDIDKVEESWNGTNKLKYPKTKEPWKNHKVTYFLVYFLLTTLPPDE